MGRLLQGATGSVGEGESRLVRWGRASRVPTKSLRAVSARRRISPMLVSPACPQGNDTMSRTIVSGRCGMALLLCLTGLLTLTAGPREEQWNKVEDAVRKGLPKTAIQELEPILQAALRDKAY